MWDNRQARRMRRVFWSRPYLGVDRKHASCRLLNQIIDVLWIVTQGVGITIEMGTIMIKKELEEAVALSMIFDATPHVGEVLAIVFRFLNPNNSITHRLGALRMYKYGFTGAQLAESIVDILLEEYKIPRSKVRTGTMDGCAVNSYAMDLIRRLGQEDVNILGVLGPWRSR